MVLAVDRARRQVDVGLGDGVLHLVDAHPEGGHSPRVELGAHRVLLRAEDLHLSDPADGGDPLGEHGLGVLVHGVERQGGRAQREVQDGLVGWIHLLVRRRRRHAGGKERQRGSDGGLDVLGGRVDAAIEGEHHRDLGQAEGARGGHRVDARDRRELTLERGGHGGGHGVGVRPGQARGDLDDREIHVGQVARGKLLVRHEAEDEEPAHEHGRHDGTPDEEIVAHRGVEANAAAD